MERGEDYVPAPPHFFENQEFWRMLFSTSGRSVSINDLPLIVVQ